MSAENTKENETTPTNHVPTTPFTPANSDSITSSVRVPAYQIIPSPVLARQSTNIGTNDHIHPSIHPQYYSQYQPPSFPGSSQPHTMPIVIATQKQLDYVIAKRVSPGVPHHHQYSGTVQYINQSTRQPVSDCGRPTQHLTNPALTNPALTNPETSLPVSYNSFTAQSNNVMNTQNDKGKSCRRNTAPTISQHTEKQQTKREATYKRSSYSLKEYTVNEEDVTSSLLVGEDFGGYDYNFLIPSDELQDVTCPICQLVLCEPFLTSCCGAHFCHNCVIPLLRKQSPCPMCNNEDLKGIIDRRTERKINSLLVQCTKSDIGCQWTGTLTDLHTHLSPSSGDCGFVVVLCSLGCGEEYPLSAIKHHQTEVCRKRIHQCKFCNYKGIYEDIPELHWPVCEGYPVACPHNCSVNDMARKLLPNHLLQCPKRTTHCPFMFAGCTICLKGDEVETHKKDSACNHLDLLSEMVKKLISINEPIDNGVTPSLLYSGGSRAEGERNMEIIILNKKLNEKDEEILSLKGQLAALQEDCEDTKLELARIKSLIVVPPFEFIVTNFTEYHNTHKQWFSTPFYTHRNGYKMCISVDCDGADEGEGTHVSVYANLMRGEFDDSLNWPFSGVITVQLYNQHFDGGHITNDIPFGKSLSADIAGRVVDQELAESGLGVPQFIRHTLLNYNRHNNTEFLKDNRLKFCVLKVKLNN